MTEPEGRHRFPWAALLAFSATVVACVHVVSPAVAVDPQRFFGGVPPAIAATFACIAGLWLLHALDEQWRFPVYAPSRSAEGLLSAALLALPFIVAVTIADVVLRFPEGMNVALPEALLFYPAMGYIAQVLLHLAPFALLLAVGRRLFRASPEDSLVWGAILLASLPEAAFQAATSLTAGARSLLTTFVVTHLFFFGIAEFYLYRRFDFATMYGFRMIYYCYWHLAWGGLRLHWLF